LFLARRPTGQIDESCFGVREVQVPEPAADEVVVDNIVMSVDPYMYLRALGDGLAARGAYEIGQTPDGYAIGRVRESRSDLFRSGDLVVSWAAWRERFVAPASTIEPLPAGFDLSPETHLAALGATSFTAWVGITQFITPSPGQVIFISGAAGGVGMIACQLALRAGLRVVASAGSAQKCEWLESLGDVRTINYREVRDLYGALCEVAPQGLDLYFDIVGGRQLEAAIQHANPHAHFIECGTISSFVTGGEPTDRLVDLQSMPAKCITMHGYTISRFFHLRPGFMDYMRSWFTDGGPRVPTTIFEGLETAPRALRSLFVGGNLGKTLVRIA
jgi:NADPH-dependent curcumin reductase CurA